MSSPPVSPNDLRGPRDDGQRGQPASGFDSVTALQHQLQSFNFGAAPGGMSPNGAGHQSSAQPGGNNLAGAQYPQQPQFNVAPTSGPQNNVSSAGPNNLPRPPQQSRQGQAHPNASPDASNVGVNRAMSQPNAPFNPNIPQIPQQQSQSNVNGVSAPFSPYGPFPPIVLAGDLVNSPQQMPLQGQSSPPNLVMPQPPQPRAGQSSLGASQGQSHPSNLAMPQPPQSGPAQSNAGGPQGQSYPPNFAMPQLPQPGLGQSNLGAAQGQSHPSNLAMPQPPQPGAGQSNASANASGSQPAQRPSVGGNQPNNGPSSPVLIPPAPNQRQQDNRMSMGSVSPTSERMGPPPIIHPPTGSNPQQDPFQAMNFIQTNVGRGSEQPILSSQPNPGGARGQSLDPTQFSVYPAQGQQYQTTPTQATPRASLNGSQQPGQHAQQQIHRSNQVFLDPGVQVMVNQQLQSTVLQGLTIPSYPASSDITTALQQPLGDHIYQQMLTELANALHQWSQSFDGMAIKQLTTQHQNIIRGCLEIFSPMEPGIVTALNTDQLSIEGLYYTPSHRRILVEHIIALNIHIFIFSPFFPGVDVPVGKLLAGITDQLYTNRTSFSIYRLMFQLLR